MAKKSIEKRRDQGGRFLTGNIGGPGRPKGSRNKLAEKFLDDFYDIWQEEGIAALRKAARNSPARFIQVAAQLIPAHFKVEHEHTIAGLTPEELRAKVLEARAKLLDSGVDPDLLGPPPNGRNRKNASIN
jgi:hypothetical protein